MMFPRHKSERKSKLRSPSGRWAIFAFLFAVLTAGLQAQVISVSPNQLTGFTSLLGSPSSSQSFNAGGTGLTGNITITASSGFEVSLTAGSGYAASVPLAPVGGVVPLTPVFVRLAGSAPVGPLTGSVSLQSAGASTQTVLLQGEVKAASAVTITSGNYDAVLNFQMFPYQITTDPTPAPGTFRYGAVGLPAQLSVNSDTGIISGVPQQAGSFQVVLQIFLPGNLTSTPDVTKTVTFRILLIGFPNVTSGNAVGEIGVPFNYQIAADNSPTSYGASGLPPGLTIDTTTGQITGTPTLAASTTPGGAFEVNVSATNASGTGNKTVRFEIYPLIDPVIISGDATGIQGQNFFYAVTADARSENIVEYRALGLDLIGGLTLNPNTGAITGIPRNAGTFSVVLTAVNVKQIFPGTTTPPVTAIGSRQITIVITGPSVSLEGTVPQGEVYKLRDRVPWSATVTATGGTTVQRYTWVAFVAGEDIYGNAFGIEVGRGLVPILASGSFAINPGDWEIPDDGTLYNVDGGYSFVVALFEQPPATLTDLANPFLSLTGRLKIDVIANLAVPVPAVIYPGSDQKQFFQGGDIVQFQSSWFNKTPAERTGNGRLQSRPLRARDRYTLQLRMTSNPAFNVAALPEDGTTNTNAPTAPVVPEDDDEAPAATDEVNDDFDLIEEPLLLGGDLAGLTPDGASQVRRVEVTGTPPGTSAWPAINALNPYGVAAASATATAVISGGGVVSVTVDNGAGGYDPLNPPAVTFTGGGGSGATAEAVVGPDGAITDITVLTPGTGYLSPPNVIIAPPGNIVGTERCYEPAPDDGFLDIGEQVSMVTEQLIPENFFGLYFVAARVAMTKPDLDAAQGNNVFVSNSGPKIEIAEKPAPTLQPASAITTDEGQFLDAGNKASDNSSVSDSGEVVAFESSANNLLIPPQKAGIFTGVNGVGADMADPALYPAVFGGQTVTYAEIQPFLTVNRQIFLKYNQTGEVVLASREVSGQQANADCFNPSVNAGLAEPITLVTGGPLVTYSGWYVAYDSKAGNLGFNTGGRSAVYVFNTQTLETAAISRNTAGDLANGDSFRPRISSTGRFVVFESDATNLRAAQFTADIDATSGAVTGFTQRNGGSGHGYLPSAPPKVVIEASPTGVETDRATATATVAPDGSISGFTIVSPGAGYTTPPKVTVENPPPGPQQVYLHDRNVDGREDAGGAPLFDQPGNTATYLVSVNPAGELLDGYSARPVVNLDDNAEALLKSGGRMYVAFTSYAFNAPKSNGGYSMVYRAEVQVEPGSSPLGAVPSELLPVSVDPSDNPPVAVGNDPMGAFIRPDSDEPSINGDGTVISFTSAATNLIPDDTNQVPDVFVRDENFDLPGNPKVVRVSVSDERVATGVISFIGGFGDCNVPDTQVAPGDRISISDGTETVNFIFEAGLSLQSALVASAAPLPSAVYDNGVAGVGATLTAATDGPLIVDGVTTVLGDRILVKDQGDSLENGLYEVTVEGAVGVPFVLTRAADMDEGDDFPGVLIYVQEGATSEKTIYVCTTAAPVDVGVTPISFALEPPASADVPIGANIQETRDNLVAKINAAFKDSLVAEPTTPPNVYVGGAANPGLGAFVSIYIRNLQPGEAGNVDILAGAAGGPNEPIFPYTPATPGLGGLETIYGEGMAGGGRQAEDDFLDPGNMAAPPIQGVPFGSGQSSVDRTGKLVAFRTIATNLDVYQQSDENTVPPLPPFPGAVVQDQTVYSGELIRPLIFPTANVYLHQRQVLPGKDIDTADNSRTKRVSVNNFGGRTMIFGREPSGVNATTSAANHSPAISANGRFIGFSSDSTRKGGLIFGANNRDFPTPSNVRNVFLQDRRVVGENPPEPTTRPNIELTAPSDGLKVPPGSIIPISATASATLGKTIESVRLFINGAEFGQPLLQGPYGWSYTLPSEGTYFIRAVVTDSRGVTRSDSVTIFAKAPTGEAPSVGLTQPTSQITRFVLGSEFRFNLTATDTGGIVPGSANFYVNGSPLPGTLEFNDTYVASYRPTSFGDYSVSASAEDTDGNTVVSPPTVLSIAAIGRTLPTVKMLPLSPDVPLVADGTVTLRAEVQLFGADIAQTVVQFYADDVYIGDGTLDPTTNAYVLNWRMPDEARAFAEVRARVIAPNSTTLVSDPNDPEADPVALVNFSSVFSKNFLTFDTIDADPLTVEIIKPEDQAEVSVGAPVLLEATAQAPDGQGTISQVEFYRNGELVTLPAQGGAGGGAPTGAITSFPYQINFTPPAPGLYDLVALAYSTAGVIQQSDTITINAVSGDAPTVEITTPQNGLTTPQTTLSIGWRAGDADGSVQKAQLLVNGAPAIGSNGVPLEIDRAVDPASNPGSNVVTYTPPSEGQYVFVVRATDNLGNVTDSDPVTVTVDNTAVNPLPSVSLTQPLGVSYVAVGSEFYAAASAVPVAPKTIDTVSFYLNGQLITAPTGSYGDSYAARFTITERKAFIFDTGTFNQLAVGGNELFAEAKDSDGLLNASQVYRIASYGARNPLPTVTVLPLYGGSDEVSIGGNVILQARPVFPTAANQEPAVEFYANGVSIGLGTKNTNNDDYSLQWSPTEEGPFIITARAQSVNWTSSSVFDEVINGTKVVGSSISDNFITLNTTPGVQPDVEITSPSDGDVLSINTPVVVQATAIVPAGGQGAIQRVEFYQNGILIGVPDTSAPFQAEYVPPSPGTYTLIAVAYGTSGLIGSSDTVQFTAADGDAPTSFLTTSTSAGATATLSGGEINTPLTITKAGSGYTSAPEVRFVGGGGSNAVASASLNTANGSVTNIAVSPRGSGYTTTPTVVIDPPSVAVSSNSTVLLQAAAADTDGTIRQVDFLQNGVIVGTTTNAPYNFSLPVTAAGRYELVARATDNLGNVTDSPLIVLNGVKGTPPTVSISTPTEADTLTPGVPVTVIADAAGGSGTVTQVDFIINEVTVSSLVGATEPFLYSFTPPAAGPYAIKVRVTDSLGNVTDSPVVVVQAEKPAGAQPLVLLSQPSSDSRFVAGSELYLNATATKADGTVDPGMKLDFLVNGLSQTNGLVSDAETGQFSVPFVVAKSGTIYSLQAVAEQTGGVKGASSAVGIASVGAQRSFPTVEILEIVPGTPTSAGGVVPLRAVAELNGADAAQTTVQFYADGWYLGDAVRQTDGSYLLNWQTPATPRAYGSIRARVVAPNATITVGGGQGGQQQQIVYFASVFSSNFVSVNTAAGVPPLASMILPVDGSSATLNQPLTLRAAAGGSPGVASITLNGGGSGYATPPTVTIGKPGVTSIRVDNGGSGYTSAPTVTLSGGSGSGATAVAVLGSGASAGKVVRIDLTLPGTEYSSAPVVTLSAPPPGKVQATATAIVNPATADAVLGTGTDSGKVVKINVTNAGSGYFAEPVVTLSPPPVPGVQATATANVRTPTIASLQFYVNGIPLGAPDVDQPYETTYTPLSQGTYVLSVVATSTDGLVSAPDSVVVVVGGGQGPTVDIINPKAVVKYVPGTTIPVAADATPKAGARVASMQFFVDGVSLGLPDKQAPFTANFAIPGTGPYKVVAVATDNFGNVGTANVEIEAVNPVGGPPVISLNYPTPSPLTLVPGSEIWVNANAVVPTGRTVKQIRFYLDGVLVQTEALKTSAAYRYRQADANTHFVVAEVVDSLDNATFSVPLEIRAPSSIDFQPPTITLEPVRGIPAGGVTQGTSVYLVAEASAGLEAVGQVDFYANGVFVGAVRNEAFAQGRFRAVFKWQPNAVGDFDITAAARRTVGVGFIFPPSDDYSVISDPQSLSVLPPSVPPTISFVSPDAGAKFSPNTFVVATVDAQVALGRSVERVNFYVNGEPVLEDTDAPYGLPFTLSAIGNYNITAVVIDSTGQTASAERNIEAVAPTGNEPIVTITQPTPETNYVFGSVLPLNMSATDNDTIDTNSTFFYLNGTPLKAKNGFGNIYTGQYPVSSTVLALQLSASAKDNSNNTTVSGTLNLQFAQAQSIFPTIEALPLDPSATAVAGGLVQLRAKANFPAPVGTNNNAAASSRVEFFAEGVFLGVATPNTNASTLNQFTHTFDWRTPTNTNIVSYIVTARAVDRNATVQSTNSNNNNSQGVNYFASVFSPAPISVNVSTNRAPSVFITQPATNGSQVGVGITNQIVATVTNLATNASVKEVQFYLDGAFVTNDTTFPYIYDFAPTNTGLYSLAAVVVDNFGLQGSSGVRTVSAVSGTPPTVSITTPTNNLTIPQVPLTVGWNASDSDGSVESVRVLINGVPASDANGAPIDYPASFADTFNFPSEGTYVFVIRATDNLGNITDSAPRTITVDNDVPNPFPNVLLLSQPISDRLYVTGSQLYFNATATPQSPNTIASNGVTFNVFDNAGLNDLAALPTKITSSGNRVYASTYVVTAPSPSLLVRAEATDSAGNSGLSTITRLGSAAPRAPFPVVQTLPIDPSTQPVAGGVVLLRAKASFPALSGAVNTNARVEFYADGAFLGVASPNTNPATTNIFTHVLNWQAPTNTNAVSYTINSRAVSLNFSDTNLVTTYNSSSSGGSFSSTATYSFTTSDFYASVFSPAPVPVNVSTNRPPSVFISQPATNGAQVGVGITNQIVATVTNLATNASVKEVQWYVDGLFITNTTSFPHIYNFAPTNTGLYSLAAVVVDNFGLQGSSGVRTVSAVSGKAPTAKITSPPDGTEFAYGSSVNVQYTSADEDGSVQKIELLRNGVVVQTLEAPAVPLIGNGLLTDVPPSFGSYTYLVRATDNLGNVSSATADNQIDIVVKPDAANGQPVVSILQQSIADRVYVSGSQFFLNGRAQAQGTATIETKTFKFTLNGREYAGAASGLDYGSGEVFTALVNADDLAGPDGNGNSLSASVLDSNDQAGVAQPTFVYTGLSQRPLPSIVTLQPIAGSSTGAGGYVDLRAAVTFPASTPDQRRVEFYANGVYLGESTSAPVPDAQNPNLLVYTFRWQTPSDAGSFLIQSRAIALNFTRPTSTGVGTLNPDITDFYGSSVSLNRVAVNTIPGTPPDVQITAPTNGSDVRTGVAFNIQATASVPATDVSAPGAGFWSILTNTNVTPNRRFAVGDTVPENTPVGVFSNASLGALPIPASGTIRQIFPVPAAQASVAVTNGTTLLGYGGGNVQRVDFYANGLLVSSDTNSPYSASFTPPSAGPYTLVAEAYSTAGLLGVSAPVSVNSRSSEPPAVSIVSPTNGSTLSVNQPVNLVAQASDPDGSVTSVNFEVNGQPVVGSLSEFGQWTGTFTPTSAGTYSVVAIATDNSGNETRSEPSVYTVSSTSVITVAVTAPAAGEVYTVGTPIVFSADASTTVGSITSVQFFIGSQAVSPALKTAPFTYSYTPPNTGDYSVVAIASDSNGRTQTSAAVAFKVAAQQGGAPSIFLSAPLEGLYLTSGSGTFLNFTATDPEGQLDAASAKIFVNGVAQPGLQTLVDPASGTLQMGVKWTPGSAGNYNIFAQIRDAAGNTAFSGVQTFSIQNPRRNGPSVQMLPFVSAYPELAVGLPVTLRAKADFRGGTPNGVEFYANGLLIGVGTPDSTDPSIYTYTWTPQKGISSTSLSARAFALNFNLQVPSPNNPEDTLTFSVFASALSTMSAGSVEAVNPVTPNEVFVADMFDELLYRDPVYPEWKPLVDALNSGAVDRAAIVTTLMAFNPSQQIFNRDTEYGRTSATAMLPFGRLGLIPTKAMIDNFLRLMATDSTPLPISGLYSGVPGAPWNATYGMARAFQSVIFNSPEFLANPDYREITGMDNPTFMGWLRNVMFPGRSAGLDETKILNMMDTIAPQSIRQGAAAAFRSELASVFLAGGYANGSDQEKRFQLEMGTTMLLFQLTGVWDTAYGKENPYSPAVVQQVLSRAGIGGAPASTAKAARYSGLVGSRASLVALQRSEVKSKSGSVVAQPEEISGGITVNRSAKGAFTAAIRLNNGTSYRFKGKTVSGALSGTLNDPAKKATFNANVYPSTQGGFELLTGELSQGELVLSVVAGLTPARATYVPTGPHMFSLGGGGSAELRLSKSARATLRGTLPSGTKFTAATPMWLPAPGGAANARVLMHRPVKGGSAVRGWFENASSDATWQATLAW